MSEPGHWLKQVLHEALPPLPPLGLADPALFILHPCSNPPSYQRYTLTPAPGRLTFWFELYNDGVTLYPDRMAEIPV